MDKQPPLTPRIGVSACLAGQAVRYDGASKPCSAISQLEQHFRLFTFCPEVAIGLGVPRPPIQLVERQGQIRVRGVENPEEDVTEALEELITGLPGDLSGFVLKARSPSCGLGSTPLFRDGEQIDTVDGAFAAAVRQRWPALPLIDEEQLQLAEERQAFVAKVLAYGQVRH